MISKSKSKRKSMSKNKRKSKSTSDTFSYPPSPTQPIRHTLSQARTSTYLPIGGGGGIICMGGGGGAFIVGMGMGGGGPPPPPPPLPAAAANMVWGLILLGFDVASRRSACDSLERASVRACMRTCVRACVRVFGVYELLGRCKGWRQMVQQSKEFKSQIHTERAQIFPWSVKGIYISVHTHSHTCEPWRSPLLSFLKAY